ncbi:glycosyl transferase family 41-domain-containing protein [Limtongia smithiae]|uniref:glycosyl transferase family 41-domain-containing protein n=1 Tax=Limtongia smithiae TaxID=1125753 RepID=UPI0034CE9F0E
MASTSHNARMSPATPDSPHSRHDPHHHHHASPALSSLGVPADNAPSSESLHQLLAVAHSKYAAHPHSTSRDDLCLVLARLDGWTAQMVEAGLVQPVVRTPTASSGVSSPRSQTARPHYDPTVAAATSKVLEAWLLAGCIAYTLGDMNRAVKLNMRILRVDSGYVEAMSNLAAAYRLQHRDAEAEAWWSRAVNLRPTYWDAADHLFSLLCSQRRYSEAASVLAFVEQHASPSGLPDDLSRYLAIIHAKGTLLYAMDDHFGAADAFARVLTVAATGHSAARDTQVVSLQLLIHRVRSALEARYGPRLLLAPSDACGCLADVFGGDLPSLREVPDSQNRHVILQTTANTLLTLAKIVQDGIAAGHAGGGPGGSGSGNNNSAQQPPTNSDNKTASADTLLKIIGHSPSAYDVLPMYYLSLALHPSPSTANNIGILLASLAPAFPVPHEHALALEYYRYGLSLDSRHPHLYTNLGSLLKDQGRLADAVTMYEHAVACDSNFDIALANLANAVKDQGRIGDAIKYYRRAVTANPQFDEAVCGLANALNSVCDWTGRGSAGVELSGVDAQGNVCLNYSAGWISRILEIVDTQLRSGLQWGLGTVAAEYSSIVNNIVLACGYSGPEDSQMAPWLSELRRIRESGTDEGAKVVELLEAAAKVARWRYYRDLYVSLPGGVKGKYHRPLLPNSLALPAAPTVLPFHTFTIPFNAVQCREICRRTALRVSISAHRYSWLSEEVYPPPPPPSPELRVGYVSSDFNNHPLSHLMQSVFGFHRETDGSRSPVYGICYATSPADSSAYRRKIEAEAHEFVDVSGWSTQAVVDRIVKDRIHVLVNLNGFTRGARNEIFACRPAPLSIAFMGFAGTMGAEWMDYLLADRVTVPGSAVRKQSQGSGQRILKHHNCANQADWAYFEDVVFCKHSFFCCDHRQSAPDAMDHNDDGAPQKADSEEPGEVEARWQAELTRRASMRAEIFPHLPESTLILANFNQLYKIDPAIFLAWLRILVLVPNSVLWLLKFPELGTTNLRAFAMHWAGPEVANRIVFTNVAGKDVHLLRSRVPDLFLDTPECNAHTTATDVIWTGTPVLTYPRHEHKMCSRIAASVVMSSCGGAMRSDDKNISQRLIVHSEAEYEQRAAELCMSGVNGELLEMRKAIFQGRESAEIFNTRRWTRDVERAYWMMWNRWVKDGGKVTIGENYDWNLYL